MAAARKRQPIPVLPCSVARDAIAQGASPTIVAACAADDDHTERVRLAVDLIRAATEIMKPSGVHYITSHVTEDGRVIGSFQCYSDATAELRQALDSIGLGNLDTFSAYSGDRKRAVSP